MKKRDKQLIAAYSLLSLLLIGLDQLVKSWTVAHIELGADRPFLPGWIKLAYVRNYGAAYSILQHQQWLFLVLTVLIVPGLVYYFLKNLSASAWLHVSLTLVIAGGLGNFVDRLRLGYVVDMLHLEIIDFPVFNVADICVTVGVLLLYLYLMKEGKNGTTR